MKYRVLVLPEEVGVNVPQSLKDGIKCEGFMILADVVGNNLLTIQNMSINNIADAFAHKKLLLRAASKAILLQEFENKYD